MQEFFDGVSMPRNKELMRIFKDVELVESLGSGIPRILRAYGTDCFWFTENFIRLILPINKPTTIQNVSTGVQPNVQVNPLIYCMDETEISVDDLIKVYKLVYKQVYKSRWYFKKHFIAPAIEEGVVEMVYPDKPNHPHQKYRLTVKGLQMKKNQLQETAK